LPLVCSFVLLLQLLQLSHLDAVTIGDDNYNIIKTYIKVLSNLISVIFVY
jgi:hypothetical protein